jgi:hypothetical protein
MHGSVKSNPSAGILGILCCVGITLLAASAGAQSGPETDQAPQAGYDDGPVEILELADTSLIRQVWETVHPDSALPYGGEYQILIPSGPQLSTERSPSATVYLLRNGTEIGSMERGSWETLAAISDRKAEGWAAAMEGPEKQDVPILWSAIEWKPRTLLRWAEWPSGFEASVGSAVSSVQTSKPQFQRDIDFAWNQKIFSHFLLGAELHRTQYGGGLTRLGAMVADTSFNRSPLVESHEFWSDANWWWGVTAGVPGLRYTLSLANQPLPRYFWLEPNPNRAIRDHKNGELVNQWNGSSMEQDGNLSHTLNARLGILRYGFHWDMDAYTVPVQTVYLDEMPAVFGYWGAGMVIASDIMATRVWMDIPDIGFPIGFPSSFPSKVNIAFLHLDCAYRSIRSFNLGISVRIRIDNPIMNRPGA